ncbi:hypothetical protein Mhun_0867 [Methanospirillum hungatei JF-1]|uniref:Thioredoxin domain-containing protein n=1 Tax=Methanospirillum hungatei JF-1 (strain ATCC 27890 / DSM 864 / NBRC 100397 / JF-1) TaxID=323259 RepID=Q2FR91_METHJ|nr:nitrophenyl compound nitroreductase subunit ArsF family protein [Methanospirillum hungatei]ABD40618.1 hypothetical protein Mhun_0867 [Methanospirillum hungatei JF-1]
MSNLNARSRKFAFIIIITAVLFLCTAILTCSASETTDGGSSAVEKVEVYHFHLKHQCYSCIRLGELAEQTVNKNFADELESGKLVFGHVTVDDPKDKEITNRYGASGSSLMIGVYTPDGFKAEEDTRVWYKLGNPDEYEAYLKDLIEKRLSGNMN